MMAAFLWQTGGTPGGILGSPLVMMVIVMGIFYVMLIVPQQRQRKKTQAMLAAIKNGDKVVTSSGIYGTVSGIDGDSLAFGVFDSFKLDRRMLRGRIGVDRFDEGPFWPAVGGQAGHLDL